MTMNVSTPPDERFQLLVRNSIAPLLKNAGFHKKKLTWNRDAGEFVDVLEVQQSRWSDEGACTFTINVGVLYKPAYEICWGKAAPRFAQETDCTVRTRLSALLQADVPPARRTDDWFQITPATSDERLSQQVTGEISAVVLPFLERTRSVEWIREHLSAERPDPLNLIMRAIVAAKLGERGSAADNLKTVAASAPAWRERVAFVADRLNLPVMPA